MAQYIDKSAVVAEIERLREEEYPCDTFEESTGYYNALDEVSSFLDTLEVKDVKEEPVSKDLEEAAEEYAPDFSNSIASKAAVDAVRDAFKAGAEWMAGQGETLYDTINVDGKNQRWLGENLLYGDYNAGQAVIVQIRKV